MGYERPLPNYTDDIGNLKYQVKILEDHNKSLVRDLETLVELRLELAELRTRLNKQISRNESNVRLLIECGSALDNAINTENELAELKLKYGVK